MIVFRAIVVLIASLLLLSMAHAGYESWREEKTPDDLIFCGIFAVVAALLPWVTLQ